MLFSILTGGGGGNWEPVQVCWETTWKGFAKEGFRLVMAVFSKFMNMDFTRAKSAY